MSELKPMTNEEFYDAEVAPALASLSKKCQARGMSMLALVNYDGEGSIGRTLALAKDSPAMIRYCDLLARCWAEGGGVNIDSFMFAVAKDAKETGHGSVVLAQMGVPSQAAATASL